MTAEFKQINIVDTTFNFVEQCDLEIKNIKLYGVLDQDGNCKEPYFRVRDVLKYNETIKNNRKAVKTTLTKNRGLAFIEQVLYNNIDVLLCMVCITLFIELTRPLFS